MSQPPTTQLDQRIDSSDSLLIPSGEYRAPIIVAGRGSKVTDNEGKSYIDLEGGPGVSSVGHCHPRIVAAIREQAGKLIHSPGRYLSHLAISLAERLAKLTGDRLTRTFFANSGAEANDGAVKLCIKHAYNTGKSGFGIIALEHAFHGRLSLPLSLTGMAAKKKGFGPYSSFPGIVHMPSPYCYRCPLRLSPDSCGVACADATEEALKTRVPGEVAIMIAESILGVGGILVPPPEYWAKIQQMCTRHGITLIIDEVFVGFGRTGKMFGYQNFAVEPKVMSFAKAIAGGVPLGGFIATEEVGGAFGKGDHFTTFGVNNQIGLAAAHAVLDVLEEEGLVAGAARKGERVMSGLRRLAAQYEAIGDVRGLGLMIGFEMVRDREKRTPAPELAKQVYDELMKRGVLVSLTGVHNCVVRITPPLVISDEEIDTALDRLDEVLGELPH
jgi:4-aminobutyrate aminotransferase-like enzyme